MKLVQMGVSPIAGSPNGVCPNGVSPIGVSPIGGSPNGVSLNGGSPNKGGRNKEMQTVKDVTIKNILCLTRVSVTSNQHHEVAVNRVLPSPSLYRLPCKSEGPLREEVQETRVSSRVGRCHNASLRNNL